jgi:hypothetical protein
MGMMTEGKRRKEEGEESTKGRGQKGRLIQERDRWGLAWVGMGGASQDIADRWSQSREPVKTSLICLATAVGRAVLARRA